MAEAQIGKSVSAFGIASIFIGTIIGAGFASGNEIVQYFVSQGWWGLGAIVIATWGFYALGKIALKLGYHLKTRNYAAAISPSAHPFPRYYSDAMITISLFGTFVIMVAGAGGLLSKLFGLPEWLGSVTVGILVVLNLIHGIKGLIKIQEILVPYLIAGCVLVSLYGIFAPVSSETVNAETLSSPLLVHWIPNGILYVAFNFQLAIAVLVPLGAMAEDEHTLNQGITWGALGLFAGSAAIFFALMLNQGMFGTHAYPMVALAERASQILGYAYAAVLVFGLYSTAISCFYGTIVRMQAVPAFNKMGHIVGMIVVSVLGVLLSKFGFSDLVGRIYPILGFGGLLVMVFMVLAARRKIVLKSN